MTSANVIVVVFVAVDPSDEIDVDDDPIGDMMDVDPIVVFSCFIVVGTVCGDVPVELVGCDDIVDEGDEVVGVDEVDDGVKVDDLVVDNAAFVLTNGLQVIGCSKGEANPDVIQGAALFVELTESSITAIQFE